MACPPNWFRSAACTLAEKSMSRRDAKRPKRADASAGIGTAVCTASFSVHRPSPESSTYGAMSSRALPLCSNASCSSSSSQERTTEP